MKLATSTGDFVWYTDSIEEAIKSFRDSKFKYINLEQEAFVEELYDESDRGWKTLAERWGNAAEYAGVQFVASHAPCLRLFEKPGEELYRRNLLAIRNSIRVCSELGIDRIVVHTSQRRDFTGRELYEKNKKFYSELFDLMERYNIRVLTENWAVDEYHLVTGADVCEFVEYIDHPLLGICWDTAHGNISKRAREAGQYENIMACGDKLWGLHIADNFGDCHHHSWPFAGSINFDSVMQGLVDVGYEGSFTFEASYTLLHKNNLPRKREGWEYKGEQVSRLLNPTLELKKQAVELLYETGKYILGEYGWFEG